tara:strand:+ start:6285 stop:6695 length:411 start_codon:yes stop_codon:yes gene_type:complete
MIEKNIDIELRVLREMCCDLLTQTYQELGQRPSDEDVVSFAVILANDLHEDFPNLNFVDIQKAFRNGIRNTKDFHVTVKTYYGWIKSWRKVIWDNEDKTDNVDKRLTYRSKKGTGTKQLGNQIKNQLKQLRNGNNK